jgi:AcrR family transcriptional regulator
MDTGDPPVKPPRAEGQARTRLASGAVITAAAQLFTEQGYSTTTMDAVSARSDVPVSTVYRLFGSKIGILKAWLDTSITGDDAPIAVDQRPQVARLRREHDPRRLIAGYVAVAAAINQRSNAVYRVLSQAASSDAEATSLLSTIQQQRASGQRRLTQTLRRLDALRDGLTETHAADIVHALMSPEMYTLIVLDRRWTISRYHLWLTDMLCQQLL